MAALRLDSHEEGKIRRAIHTFTILPYTALYEFSQSIKSGMCKVPLKQERENSTTLVRGASYELKLKPNKAIDENSSLDKEPSIQI